MNHRNKKSVLMLGLALGLTAVLGTAGAETTANCAQPASPVIPLTTTWNFTNGGAFADGFTAQSYGGSGATGYGMSIVSFTDGPVGSSPGRTITSYADTPGTYDIGDIKFLRIGFVWAENGGPLLPASSSRAGTLNLYFAGQKILTFTSTKGWGNKTTPGVMQALGTNATLYSGSGTKLGSTINVLPLTNDNAINNSSQSEGNSRAQLVWYYLRLPDGLPTTGAFRIEAPAVPDAKLNDLFDDVRIYLPSTAQSYLCLKKQQNSGTLGQAFAFNNVGLDFANAGGTSSTDASGQTTSNVTITPAALKQPYIKSTVPGRVTNPDNVSLTETAPGYLISRVDCDKPADMSGTASQLAVSQTTTPITLTSLPFGVMTTCTVYNDSTADLVNKAPIVSYVKQFSRKSANDQVSLSLSSPNTTAKNLTTSGVAATYQVGQLQDTNYSYQGYNSGTVGTRIVYPLYTMTEAAAGGTTPLSSTNYDVSYQCVNSTQGNSTTNLPSGTLSGPYSLTVQPSLDIVSLGDTITCTITNSAKKTGSLTIQKSGPVISMPSGSSDVLVTYTITLSNPSSGGIPALNTLKGVTVTDTFTNGYYSTNSYSGTGSATVTTPSAGPGGTITWVLPDWGASDHNDRIMAVTLKMPTLAAAEALVAGNRNVSDTANYTSTRYNGVGISQGADNGVPASVTTNLILVDSPVKTVRNVTPSRVSTPGATATGNPGDTVEYCITVNNYSDLPASNYTIQDTVSPLLQPVSGSTYTLKYGVGGSTSNTISQTSPFSQTIGTIPAATTSGPGVGTLCFQATIK